MRLKNIFLIFMTFIMLSCLFGAVNALENVTDNVHALSDNITSNNHVIKFDSSNELISINNENDKLENSIYYVSNSSTGGNGSQNNPYNWTKAYSESNDGDEIKFIKGYYSGNFIINKNLTLTGDNTIISSLIAWRKNAFS